jgi:hypothetical protein
LAETAALKQTTTFSQPRLDQINVQTNAQFKHEHDGTRRLLTQTTVTNESNALTRSRSRVKFEQDKLPDLDYDSASIYGFDKSPVYSPRSKKSLHTVSKDGLTQTIVARSVTHDLSRVPVPQTRVLSDEEEALILTTLTELLHDYRIVEKEKIELSLRSDFNVK